MTQPIPSSPGVTPAAGGHHVLVVDDSAVMRTMVSRTLRLSGLPIAAIHEASNGQMGLAALWTTPVDLALVDLNMPVMSGEEMIVALRGDPATAALPVIVVSTESSDLRIQRLATQRVTFVHKPFTPEQLRDVILKTMGANALLPSTQGAPHDVSIHSSGALAGGAPGHAGVGGDVDF
ncbi:MAG: response regulator [Gemmatimonadaceae bacterium]